MQTKKTTLKHSLYTLFLQTISQALATAREHLARSLLKWRPCQMYENQGWKRFFLYFGVPLYLMCKRYTSWALNFTNVFHMMLLLLNIRVPFLVSISCFCSILCSVVINLFLQTWFGLKKEEKENIMDGLEIIILAEKKSWSRFCVHIFEVNIFARFKQSYFMCILLPSAKEKMCIKALNQIRNKHEEC